MYNFFMSENKEIIQIRENVIGYLYSYELLNRDLDSIDAFEIGDYNEKEIKYIEHISKNYNIFKKLATKFTKESWPWERISVLSRSILIYGIFELSFNDAALVIDVIVQYTKNFEPDDSYKFIHSILDKVGKYYETIKTNKK